MTLLRVRVFVPYGTGYTYKKTVTISDQPMAQLAEAMMRNHGLEVGDLIYAWDYFMVLDKIEDRPHSWRTLSADRPELRGLYAQAVEAERDPDDGRWRC